MLLYPIWILQWWHWTNMSSIGDWLSLLLSVTLFFFQCSASLIKSLVNTSWCVFLHRDADGDSHWYDYQANAKYAISCYSSHLVIYRLQCVLVLLFCFNPLDCFLRLKQKQSHIIWITHWQPPVVGLLETIWSSRYYWLNYHIVSKNSNWQHIEPKISFSTM